MAGVKYKSGSSWVDMENSGRIKEKVNGKWDSKAAKVFKKSGSKWVQLYPSVEVATSVTLTGTGLDYINATSTNWKKTNTARQGQYSSYGQCVGWLGIRGSQVPNYQYITQVTSVTVDYERYGIGSWGSGTPLVISETSKTSKSTGGSSHYSSLSRTMKSDGNMATCSSSQGYKTGTVTFNKQLTNIMNWIKSGKYLVVGGSGAAYAGTRKFVMKISYKYKVSKSIDEFGQEEYYYLPDEKGKFLDSGVPISDKDKLHILGAENPTFVNSTNIYYDEDVKALRIYCDIYNIKSEEKVEFSLDGEIWHNMTQEENSTSYSLSIHDFSLSEHIDKAHIRFSEEKVVTIIT